MSTVTGQQKGELIAVGPLIKTKDGTLVPVQNPDELKPSHDACTCVYCRMLDTDDRNTPA